MHCVSINNIKGYDYSMPLYFLSIRKINPGQGYSSMVEDLSRMREAMCSIPALRKETLSLGTKMNKSDVKIVHQ